ncbi:uncharacterized protein MELLADRAFT_87519 [Melampsora larici-populina 98AG31]|uniref:Uncharacterized protein n=1 Tax=Melampsora larici-populina (strain 98AG31 / pathotype 3-4-7) TaxID=747676 RepID=F4RNM3_MELLP|nr:uncharacterized protein MELLADRAFT_87519 [Melampsora larici-populina 98AG31]EGG06006.1 hypothetical protein MELLADRAFT_87519 [Melampsora larici-populina 98AG31]
MHDTTLTASTLTAWVNVGSVPCIWRLRPAAEKRVINCLRAQIMVMMRAAAASSLNCDGSPRVLAHVMPQTHTLRLTFPCPDYMFGSHEPLSLPLLLCLPLAFSPSMSTTPISFGFFIQNYTSTWTINNQAIRDFNSF